MRKVVVCIWIAVIAAFIACGSDPEQQTCKNIPAGGCPLAYGLACQDPTCVAAYACNPDGTWTLDHTCALNDASASLVDSGANEASTATFDASYIDAPPGAAGGPGCPALENPDCSLAAGLACPVADDCCDCEDLWVCTNGDWIHWGVCDSSGIHEDTN